MPDAATLGLLPTFEDILRDHPGWLDQPIPPSVVEVEFNIPATTLSTQRSRGGGIPYLKLGSRVFYTRRKIYERLLAGERTSTSDPGSVPQPDPDPKPEPPESGPEPRAEAA